MPSMGWMIQTPTAGIINRLGYDEANALGLEASAKLLETTWRRLLSGTGSGRIYTHEWRTFRKGGKWVVAPVRFREGGPHVASEQGSPPAQDSGELAGSIQRVAVTPRLQFIFSTHPAAPILEFGMGGTGTFEAMAGLAAIQIGGRGVKGAVIPRFGPHPAGIIIEPRPALRPAIAQVVPQMSRLITIFYRTQRRPQSLQKRSVIQMVRAGIIGFSAAIGDLRAIGVNIGAVNKVRGGLLRVGRILGDVNAVQRGEIGQRLIRRAVGRQAGKTVESMIPAGTGRFGSRVLRRMFAPSISSVINRI